MEAQTTDGTVTTMNDPVLQKLLAKEEERQRDGLELIPSENYASPAVRAPLASVLANKYSEGTPGKRYYGGQEVIDAIERLAQERALALFLAPEHRSQWHVNVQPYSGSPANAAALAAVAPLGSRIMGLALSHGGHLTHGHRVSFSGTWYEAHQYTLHPATQRLDYEAIRKLAREVRPSVIISGATAYPRTIDFRAFQDIAAEVGAVHLADIAHLAGLIAGGAHPSPFPFTNLVTSTTHKTLRGPRGAVIFCQEQYAQQVDRAVFPLLQGGPHNHTTAAMAACFFEALQREFRAYAHQVVKNAQALAERFLERGMTIVTGGTDNHLLVLDLRPQNLTGKEAERTLDVIGITVNKNTIPDDPRPPSDPSGVRLGTPAVTTRGMKEPEMRLLADWIHTALTHAHDVPLLTTLREKVRDLARAHPLPGEAPVSSYARNPA